MLRVLIAVSLLTLTMQTTTKQIVNAGPPPVGPYSPAVKAGGFITSYCRGCQS